MYSQLNEEEIILDYFSEARKNKISLSGNILDIGANDGITLSNTRALILKYPDIKGYFVEPNPECFSRLKNLYDKNHELYFFAIGETDGKLPMYCNKHHISPSDIGLLSTLIQKETQRWGDEKWEIIDVDVVRYPFNDIEFDFISIDAEGMDESILFQIDLSKNKLLCIEWNSVEERKQSIDNYCKSFRLELIHENSINLIYGRR